MINLPEFDTGQYEGCELLMAKGSAILTIRITGNPPFALHFQKVRWHQFTALYNCASDMIEGAYFRLSEVSPSSALAVFLQADQSPSKAYRELHHYRIFLDETGCHEFFAESVRAGF